MAQGLVIFDQAWSKMAVGIDTFKSFEVTAEHCFFVFFCFGRIFGVRYLIEWFVTLDPRSLAYELAVNSA